MIIYYVLIFSAFLFFFGTGMMFYAFVLGAPTVYTPKRAVSLMVKEADLKDGEIIYDLGCGDGRILFEAVKRKNVLAFGFELFYPVYLWVRIKSLFLKGRGQIKIKLANFWKADFNKADVIFCFLMPRAMQKVGEKFKKEAKTGAKLISYCFKVNSLKPEKVVELKGIAPIYVYIKN